LYSEGYTIDYFTNGSFKIPSWIIGSPHSTIVLDYKLPGSGEYNKDSENRYWNVHRMDSRHAIKFTVASEEDLDMASMIWHSIISTDVQVYLGPVWDMMTAARCAEYILERRLPWKLNVQVHKFIWDEKARGI
jgi:7-carboxy-7-deazaguanine synthase